MIVLSPDMYGCVSREAYAYTKNPSQVRQDTIRGRPRYRLKDPGSMYVVNTTFNLPLESGLSAWQDFWESIDFGTKPFKAYLMFDSAEHFAATENPFTVRAMGAWTATTVRSNYCRINLDLEIANADIIYDFCDKIYGGPLYALSLDDISGGPITDLAEDVIHPCPGVDPNE